MTDQPATVARPTLGERLAAQGRELAVRGVPRLLWAGPLRVAAEHAIALAEPFDGRFERIESPPLDSGRNTEPGEYEEVDAPALAGLRTHLQLRTRAQLRAGARASAAPTATPDPANLASSDPTPVPPTPAPAAGRPLPADLRGRLRDVVGPAADALRVHDDEAADALARAHRADAVTLGRDVYFRTGRFRPYQERGFALLAHEATHVLAMLRPGAAWHRSTGGGRWEEEQQALATERAVRAGLGPGRGSGPVPGRENAHPPTPHSLASGHHSGAGHHPAALPEHPAAPALFAAGPAAGAPLAAPSSAAHPMRAAEDRDLGPPPVAERPGLDVAALRRDLMSELMRRLRTEFERGG